MSKKLNVLLICKNDWANLGYKYSQALKSVGVNAIAIIMKRHPLKYPKQGLVVNNTEEIKKYVLKADIIHYMHSQKVDFGGANIDRKAVVVSHTGSAYRHRHKRLNAIFNPIVQATLVGGNLGGRGAKNEHWIQGGVVDTNILLPIYEHRQNKIVIAHYPSNEKTKNSKGIKKVIDSISGDFIYKTGSRIPWHKQIRRVKGCDIYVESLLSNSIGFGITCLEVAALGKIIITSYNNELKNKYEKNIGNYAPYMVKSEKELYDTLLEILSLSEEEQLAKRKQMREWVVKYHSYKAMGNSLLSVYKEILK